MKKIIMSLMIILCSMTPSFAVSSEYAIVSATNVRIRNIPSTKGAVMATLKLGTWARITAISNEQQHLIGKDDFWYKISDEENNTGWIFGALIIKTSLQERFLSSVNLINTRLKLLGKPIKDEIQLYEFVTKAQSIATDKEQKGKLEYLRLNTIQKIVESLSSMGEGKNSDNKILKANRKVVYFHESAGQYFVSPQKYWELAEKYSDYPGLAEEIAWTASEQQLPGETEGDPFAILSSCENSHLIYIKSFPLGPNAKKALDKIENTLKGVDEGLAAYKDYFTTGPDIKDAFKAMLSSIAKQVKRCKNSKTRREIIKLTEKLSLMAPE